MVLTLASASPRRREMLERVGVPLEVRPADVDESPVRGEPPRAYVMRIALAKAQAVGAEWVLAADTTVTIDREILAKAESPEEAAQMLRTLSGRTHQVCTGFVLMHAGKVAHAAVVATDVEFLPLDEAMIADYVACGEWRGKAGAYAVQGIGAAMVRAVRGSVTNVIGLPLAEVLEALRAAGGPAASFIAGQPQ